MQILLGKKSVFASASIFLVYRYSYRWCWSFWGGFRSWRWIGPTLLIVSTAFIPCGFFEDFLNFFSWIFDAWPVFLCLVGGESWKWLPRQGADWKSVRCDEAREPDAYLCVFLSFSVPSLFEMSFWAGCIVFGILQWLKWSAKFCGIMVVWWDAVRLGSSTGMSWFWLHFLSCVCYCRPESHRTAQSILVRRLKMREKFLWDAVEKSSESNDCVGICLF